MKHLGTSEKNRYISQTKHDISSILIYELIKIIDSLGLRFYYKHFLYLFVLYKKQGVEGC